jgi:hypothetical protein
MKTNKPTCYSKCDDCFYFYTESCKALCGDDFFTKVKERHIDLIINNKDRFNISEEMIHKMESRFALSIN